MSDATPVRLQKFLAQAGVASRRHAEALIVEGRVEVDGRVVTELGTRIDPEASRVRVDGRVIGTAAERVTVVLNKPAGVLSTMKDPEGRRTVRDLVESEPFRMVPIGRLDYASEGALLLTTDGELAHRLMHPSFKAPKVYTVKVGGQPTDEKLEQLRKGVRLEDGRTQPAVIEVVKQDERHTWLEFVLTEGRNRQIRRMCDAIGHRAFRVYRNEFAGVSVDGLRPGQFRYLSPVELARLYEAVGLEGEVPEPSKRALELAGRPVGAAERRKGALPGETRDLRPVEPQERRGGRPNTRRNERPVVRSKKTAGREPVVETSKRRRAGAGEGETAPRKPVGISPTEYRKRRGPRAR